MPGTVQNRGAYQTGGSIGGSLGGSMAGSALAGAVLGPVGAVAGMIGGAIAGSRAGAAASEGVCDAVDATAGQLCPDCKEASTRRPVGHQNWGGGKLGSNEQETTSSVQPSGGEEQSVGVRVGAGLSDAASRTGETLSGMGSWLKNSVSSITGGSSSQDPAQNNSTTTTGTSFKPFAGSGQTLGSSSQNSEQRSAAAEAAMRRLSGGGYTQAGATATSQQAPVAPATSQRPIPPVAQQQLSDEELARQLQAQFDAEGR